MRKIMIRSGIAGAAALAALGLGVPLAAAASADSATLYVSPSGGSGANTSCDDAGYSSVQSAVDAAPAGGTVVVCAGTYTESVTIATPVTLAGQPGAVIDATDQPYGVGMIVDNVTVTGLTVENAAASAQAPGDGIITAGFGEGGAPAPGNHETIVGNRTFHNQGAGIDVETSSYTTVSDNVSMHNGIGINVVDDFGVAVTHDRIIGNRASQNPGGCGIVLAEHSGVGVHDNVVRGNIANNNGLGSPSAPDASAGSGIIIAGGGPSGGVYHNVVQSNQFFGNGHGGIAIHVHSPGLNFDGNRLLGNVIGRNNLRTDTKDKQTTGVYIGSVSPLHILMSGNSVRRDAVGVFTAGPVHIKNKQSTAFHNVKKWFKAVKTYPSE